MRMDERELSNFLSSTVHVADVTANVDLLRRDPEEEVELSPEENEELVRGAMQNLGITQHEPRPEEYPGIPRDERPIVMPEHMEIRQEVLRFSDAEWFNEIQGKTIVLAGVGGIGSNMAVILAKLNPQAIYLFDDDVVDSTNMAGQFYSRDDVGRMKTDALASTITKFANYSSAFSIPRAYYHGEAIVSDIMVCGFDNMSARRSFFQNWKERVVSLSEEERKKCLFIDGRLTADEFQIFCMTGEDDYYMETYQRDFLFNDYEARELPCSFKQTGFLAQMIGSFMVNLLVNFCANLVNPLRGMALPFKTSYRSDMMYLDLVK